MRFYCFAYRSPLDLRKVDINGDGMMEWDEFTRFVVVKAQLHHAQMSIDQLAEYRQGSRQVWGTPCKKRECKQGTLRSYSDRYRSFSVCCI